MQGGFQGKVVGRGFRRCYRRFLHYLSIIKFPFNLVRDEFKKWPCFLEKKEVRAMKKYRSLVLAITAAFLLALVGSGCGGTKQSNAPEQPTPQQTAKGETATKKLKVALLLPGPISDRGWNATAYEGLKLAEKNLGVETAYREMVSQSDQVEAFRAFATQGYDMIIAHGFEFGDAAKKVASEFPEVKFVVTSSDITQAPNLGSLQVHQVESGFLGGVIAGMITKTGKVGYIGGMEIPPIVNASKGFIAGARWVNPDVKVLSTFIGTFEDPAKAKETAISFIQQGVDVVLGNADQAGLGVIQAAKEKGVVAIGYPSDQSSIAPDTVIASCLESYPFAIEFIVKTLQEGKFEPKFYAAGINEGATGMVWNPNYPNIPGEVKEKVAQVIEDLKAGKIDVLKLYEQYSK